MESGGITRRGALAMLSALSFGVACRGRTEPAKEPAAPGKTAKKSEASFDPARTHVFMVSVLSFLDPAYGGFPTEGRRDVVLLDALKERGVPKKNVRVLLDTEGKKKAIAAAFREKVAQVGKDELLIVYYAGHGTRDKKGATYFIPHDVESDLEKSAWSVASIFDELEKIKGSVFITADCCSSGALVDEAKARNLSFPCGVVSSSLARESSTGHWTFTDCLISAVTGDRLIDDDEDGDVDMAEVSKFAEEEMAWAEGQLATATTVGGFPSKFVFAKTRGKKPKHPRIGERLEAQWKGDWYPARIIDHDESKGFKIHYPGYGDDWEEWVPPARLRKYAPKRWPTKTNVEIEWNKQWYPGRVLDEKLGVHFVTYDGYGKEWDEWVPSSRIRALGSSP